MATAAKHMERSRRSHHNKANYSAFHMKAYKRAVDRQQKSSSVSLVDMLKSKLAPHRKSEGGK